MHPILNTYGYWSPGCFDRYINILRYIQIKWVFCFAVCWQGVTLTDLKEAEKTMPKAADQPLRNIQPVSPIVTVTPAERGEWGLNCSWPPKCITYFCCFTRCSVFWGQMSLKQYLVISQDSKQSSHDHKCSTASHKSVSDMCCLPVTPFGWRPTSVYCKTRGQNKKTWCRLWVEWSSG